MLPKKRTIEMWGTMSKSSPSIKRMIKASRRKMSINNKGATITKEEEAKSNIKIIKTRISITKIINTTNKSQKYLFLL